MDDELKSKVRYMTVPKGHVILYLGDMWYSQGINLTNNPRVDVLANFSPLHIPPKDDILLQISKCRDEFLVDDYGRVLLDFM
jgi:ectoine hydroxylase-related dioxygenase (phytanoyl-CoA dioxygenase family)